MLSNPINHPVLSLLLVAVVLVDTALPCRHHVVAAALCVLGQRRLEIRVRKRVERLWLPLHDLILLEQLDELGSPQGTYSAQVVEPSTGCLSRHVCLRRHSVREVLPQGLFQLFEGGEACTLQLQDRLHEDVRFLGYEPSVVNASLGDRCRCCRLELV